MIRHAGSRTRTLYRWESRLINRKATGGNRKVRSAAEGRLIIDRIWQLEGRKGPVPTLEIKKMRGYPYYEDAKHAIVLTSEDHSVQTLVHEITHALGVGRSDNHHSEGFVKKYCKLLAFQFGWSEEQLLCEAKDIKLL